MKYKIEDTGFQYNIINDKGEPIVNISFAEKDFEVGKKIAEVGCMALNRCEQAEPKVSPVVDCMVCGTIIIPICKICLEDQGLPLQSSVSPANSTTIAKIRKLISDMIVTSGNQLHERTHNHAINAVLKIIDEQSQTVPQQPQASSEASLQMPTLESVENIVSKVQAGHGGYNSRDRRVVNTIYDFIGRHFGLR